MANAILLIVLKLIEIIPFILSESQKSDLQFTRELLRAKDLEEKMKVIEAFGRKINNEQDY